MSPSRRIGSTPSQAHALLDTLTNRLRGPMRRALTRALDSMQANMNVSEVEALLRRNDVGGAIKSILDAGNVTPQSILRTQFSTALDAGASVTLKSSANRLVGKHFTQLLSGSPRAAAAMERLELQFFPPIFNDTETVLRRAFTTGLNAGINPRSVARTARGFIGLTEHDFNTAASYEFDLRAGNFAEALSRQLRDARLDGLLHRAADAGRALTNAEISTLTTRYNERLVAWRAETWSRTASLNAARESQLVAWQEAADVSGLETDEVTKEWITTMDGRERDEHAAANGIVVDIDEEFPVDGGVQTPGENVYNCRCTFVVRVIPSQARDRSAFFTTRTRG